MNQIRTLNYKPAGKTIEDFHRDDSFVRLILGPVGSGKSYACSTEIMFRCAEQWPSPDGKRYSRVAIIRNSRPELVSTTLKTWEQIMPRTVGKPVFAMFRDSFHTSDEVLEPIPGIPLVIGCDFGLTPAAIIGQRLADSRWLIIDERVAEDVGIQRFGESLRAHLLSHYPNHTAALWADPAGNARSMNDEQTSLEVLQSQLPGVRCRPAPSNNLTERLEAVKACLNRAVDGKAGILFSPTCIVLRKSMAGGYHYRAIHSSSGARIMETPEKNKYSHPADALQYLLSGGGEYQAVLQHPLHKQSQRGYRGEFARLDYDILDTDF